MADSVRETIMDTLKTELEAITVANGYSQTVALVQRGQPNEAVVKQGRQPAIWLYGGPETKTMINANGLAASGEQRCELELNIVFLARSRGDLEQTGVEFCADIESVLVTPNARTIASTVVDITANGNLILVGTPDDQQAGGHAQFTVAYSTKLGDPRTGA